MPWAIGAREVVQLYLTRAQRLPYAHDEAGAVDLVTADLATVEREGGDCEERAMYLVAHLVCAGIPARLAWIVQPPPAPLDHVSAQVRLDGRWLWADPTVPGARIGERPERAAGRVAQEGGHVVGLVGG